VYGYTDTSTQVSVYIRTYYDDPTASEGLAMGIWSERHGARARQSARAERAAIVDDTPSTTTAAAVMVSEGTTEQ